MYGSRQGNDVGNSVDSNSRDDDSLRSAGLAFTRDIGRYGSQSVVPRFTNDDLELPDFMRGGKVDRCMFE
jgi:hypothetical protein